MWTPNLCPVIATCWLLCHLVNGEAALPPQVGGPLSHIEVKPPLSNVNTTYYISWEEYSTAYVVAIYLVDVESASQSPVTSRLSTTLPPNRREIKIRQTYNTVQTILPFPACLVNYPCSSTTLTGSETVTQFTLASSVILDPTRTYQIQIQYATASVVPFNSGASDFTMTAGSLLPGSGVSLNTAVNPGPATTSGGSSSATNSASSPSATITTAVSSSLSPSSGSTSTSSPIPVAGVSPTSESSSGLSTGAKVGIAIGAVGFVLLVLIAVLLLWRRRKQRQLRASANGAPYTHDLSSTNRDLTAEKEMNVMSSPVGLYTPTDTWNTGMTAVSETPATEPQTRSQTQSWAGPGEHVVPYTDDATGLYTDNQRTSVHSPTAYEDPTSQPQTAPAIAPVVQRKPVATVAGPTQHLREPGMSDEEVARLEEEERRLDEAIAEAERRREQQR